MGVEVEVGMCMEAAQPEVELLLNPRLDSRPAQVSAERGSRWGGNESQIR